MAISFDSDHYFKKTDFHCTGKACFIIFPHGNEAISYSYLLIAICHYLFLRYPLVVPDIISP